MSFMGIFRQFAARLASKQHSLLVLAAFSLLQASSLPAAEPHSRSNPSDQAVDLIPADQLNIQVESRVQIKGELHMNPNRQAQPVPMDVLANYRYGERLARQPDSIKSVRFYDQAMSQIKLDTGQTLHSLSDDNRYLIVEWREAPKGDKRIRYQSPQPTLTEQELNLINIPASTMVLGEWLAQNDVEIEDSWHTPDDLLADILTWDFVDKNEITATLDRVANGVAEISLAGTAEGLIDGANTEVNLKGTCHYELQGGLVRSIRLKLIEKRSASLVAPGYDATIWLETNIQPTKRTQLTNASLGKLSMSRKSRADQFRLSCEAGPYELLHPRHWRVISNQSDRTVLRCIRNGRVLGQCDIVALPDQPADFTPSLQQFKATVEKSVAEKGGRVVHSQDSPAVSRYSWMRIDATSEIEEIPMRWLYYTVVSPTGKRVQVLFTLEQEVYDEFNGYDRELIDALQFRSTDPDANEDSANRDA